MDSQEPQGRPGGAGGEWLFGLLGPAAAGALASFASVLNTTMTDVAIPLISRDLDVFDAEAGWIVTGYALIFAKSLPMYGRISDFFSLRRTFSLALVVFAAGSLICALAPSFPRLALLDANGPTGTFSNASGPLPW